MRWHALCLPLLAMALLPVRAAAQLPPQPTAQEDDMIIVEGERLTPKQVRERARGFIRTLGVTHWDQGAARWVQPVCPKVTGLSPDHARIVTGRVRDDIAAIGAPLAGADCRTNFLIAFVSDGKEVVKLIDRKRSSRMAQVQGPDRRALLESDAPIRWWYTISTGSSDGSALTMAPPGTMGNNEGGGSILPSGIPVGLSAGSSLLRAPTVRTLSAATVIIDVNRAQGVSLNATASYAAFVGLAEVRAKAAPPLASILNLFAAQAGPAGAINDLTDWDRRFLVRLYDLPLDRFGRMHRAQLEQALTGDDEPQGDD
jgi:hypothetical protein